MQSKLMDGSANRKDCTLAQTDPCFQVEADSLDNTPRDVTDCKNVLLGKAFVRRQRVSIKQKKGKVQQRSLFYKYL